jgi:hypothetical protein
LHPGFRAWSRSVRIPKASGCREAVPRERVNAEGKKEGLPIPPIRMNAGEDGKDLSVLYFSCRP